MADLFGGVDHHLQPHLRVCVSTGDRVLNVSDHMRDALRLPARVVRRRGGECHWVAGLVRRVQAVLFELRPSAGGGGQEVHIAGFGVET